MANSDNNTKLNILQIIPNTGKYIPLFWYTEIVTMLQYNIYKLKTNKQ